MAAAIKNVTVIGGGLMGSGIAQVKKKVFVRVCLRALLWLYSTSYLLVYFLLKIIKYGVMSSHPMLHLHFTF
jgi:hypothetical protein